MDLTGLSRDELTQLSKDVNHAIATYQKRRLAKARAELEVHAKQLGVTLKDVMEASSAGPFRVRAPVKYRNPKNPEETWTGRGRKPRWLTAALTSVNTTLEDFTI